MVKVIFEDSRVRFYSLYLVLLVRVRIVASQEHITRMDTPIPPQDDRATETKDIILNAGRTPYPAALASISRMSYWRIWLAKVRTVGLTI
jgi:hypothetical protein